MQQLKTNPILQTILLVALVVASACGVYFTEKSVSSFLLLLISILLLYYCALPEWLKWVLGLLIVGFVIPFAATGSPFSQSYMEVAVRAGIYVAMALGLNVVVGFAGLLDLGFIAFFAIGAYTYGIFASPQAKELFSSDTFPLSGEWFWLFIVIGAIIAAIFGVLLGVPVLRVKGDYLAIVTLGFGEIIRIIFNNLDQPVNITNGALGLSSIQSPELFGYPITKGQEFYYIVLGILLIVIYCVRTLEHSKMGRAWKAIREDEIAAQAMGIPLVRTKLWAFAIGASFSGMMGVVFAAKDMFIDPTSFTLVESITILVMVILGGMGSIPGVILGAVAITTLNLQILNEITMFLTSTLSLPDALSPAKMQRLIFGIVLVLVAIYRPQGLIPARNKKVNPEDLKTDTQHLPLTNQNTQSM